MTWQRAGLFSTITTFAIVSWGLSFGDPSASLKTADDLQSLRQAMVAYVGTMGSEPQTLRDLWFKGSQPDFAFDVRQDVGAGWLGPYITDDIAERLALRHLDRFGNEFRYTSDEMALHIRSAGPDEVMDTKDDLTSDVPRAELFATISGTVSGLGHNTQSIDVTLNVPRNGRPSRMSARPDRTGSFSFSDVPVGYRTISVSTHVVSVHVKPGSNTVPPIRLGKK